MNRERVQQLRDHIASLPSEKFIFKRFFDDIGADNRWVYEGVIPECGTVGCIAGYALTLFRDFVNMGRAHGQMACRTNDVIVELLDLDRTRSGFYDLNSPLDANNLRYSRDYYLLCLRDVAHKGKRDAVARLDHLLARGTMQGYNYSAEPRPDFEETRQETTPCRESTEMCESRGLRPSVSMALR